MWRSGQAGAGPVCGMSSPVTSSLAAALADAHRGLDPSEPERVHLPGAVGPAARRPVRPHGLGGAHHRVGQHHGLADSRAGQDRLRAGHDQPALGQAQRAKGEKAERERLVSALLESN